MTLLCFHLSFLLYFPSSYWSLLKKIPLDPPAQEFLLWLYPYCSSTYVLSFLFQQVYFHTQYFQIFFLVLSHFYFTSWFLYYFCVGFLMRILLFCVLVCHVGWVCSLLCLEGVVFLRGPALFPCELSLLAPQEGDPLLRNLSAWLVSHQLALEWGTGQGCRSACTSCECSPPSCHFLPHCVGAATVCQQEHRREKRRQGVLFPTSPPAVARLLPVCPCSRTHGFPKNLFQFFTLSKCVSSLTSKLSLRSDPKREPAAVVLTVSVLSGRTADFLFCFRIICLPYISYWSTIFSVVILENFETSEEKNCSNLNLKKQQLFTASFSVFLI